MKKSYLLLLLLLCSLPTFAQDYFPKNDGVKTEEHTITAFTNAKIYVTPTQVIENGTLIIQDGKVVQTGTNISIPKNATVVDLTGKSVYPSFIDPYSDFGLKKPTRNFSRSAPQYDAEREGYYWNDHIRPDTNPMNNFSFDKKKATSLLKAGFGTVNTHMQDGIVRGNGMLIALNSDADNSNRILDNRSAQYLSYSKSNASRQTYPTSLMGSMALIRQMYHDADWYAKGNAKRRDLALEALLANKSLVQIFHSGNKHNSIKTDAIGDEFGIQYTLVGNGTEYENINAMKATNASFIIPINFPKAYDVSDPYAAGVVELEAMKHWNQAPSNPKALADKGIVFSFTMHDTKSGSEFKENLLKAIKYGLDKTKALEALTTIPARILQQEDKVGSLQNGRQANFLITSGDIFDKKTVIYENWVQGSQNVFKDKSQKDLRGKYTFNVAGNTYDVTITGSPEKLKAKVMKDSLKLGSKISFKNDWLQMQFTTIDTTKTEFIRLNSPVRNTTYFSGKAILENGSETTFSATQQKVSESKDKKGDGKDKKMEAPKVLPLSYPNGAYGSAALPKQENILFKNATVWTNEKDGILQNTDVLVKNGKIARVGKNLSAGNARIIDATGKHLTSGVIDEHSHIGAFAINEAGHNSTAEVNMEDVVNPEDVDIYRNLAGGVTTIQLLHGSANPIGGRSAILSLKWGRSADEMLFDGADGFIKFALGENVKQSNWGDTETIRFPQTRMGVEQVFTDYFQRAKEYEVKKKTGNYRYDIEMETIVEILNKKRFVSCHSYVQSEINMLMKVAEKFDFNINTFTHILEGYKVADKMKAHGAGGSTFSDWWAYKFEVNDAIPYNGAIMHSQGVVVAFNSDDGEMSRRLNQEAAKAVKYGGVSEEDAWKFVTLNPAKLLHIDNKVGSIKTGKQADLVLWTDHPMSIYTKAQTTMIEGTVYFDLERDAQLRRKIKSERTELMNMMLLEKNKGMKTQPAKKKDKVHHHCDTVEF